MPKFFDGSLTRTSNIVAIAAVGCVLSVTAVSAGCAQPNMPNGANSVIPKSGINQELFSQAVMAYVNYDRCKTGLGTVAHHGGLTTVAKTHARWMANKSTLSHKSTVSGQSSVKARVSKAVRNWRAGSENIGYVYRYRVDEVPMFYTRASQGQCVFTTKAGNVIPPHTYASLAQRAVALWLASPSHRKNVLDRKVDLIGTAVAYDSKGPNCGTYYLSQEFAG